MIRRRLTRLAEGIAAAALAIPAGVVLLVLAGVWLVAHRPRAEEGP